MCWDQHVSAKAWRFQNNLFQLVHSCAVTSIFDCCWSFLALGFDTRNGTGSSAPAQPRRGWPSGKAVQISNNEDGGVGDIELTSAYPGLREHLQLGNPVK